MQKNKKYRQVITAIFLSLLGCAAAIGLWFYQSEISPYQEFKAAEARVKPQLIAMNGQIYKSFPPPAGVTQIYYDDRSVFEHSTVTHGIMLFVQYDMNGLSNDDVRSYYKLIFERNDWKIAADPHSVDMVTYFKNYSCVTIDLYHLNDTTNGTYAIEIWNDPTQLSFYPTIPVSAGFFEFGETIILYCPPEH